MNTARTYPPTLLVVIASIFSAVVVTACGPEKGEPTAAEVAAQTAPAKAVPQKARPAPERERPVASPYLGRISNIDPITETSKPSGAGAVIGGVAGGVLGHQIGDGNGKKAATALGAIGGAVAGHQIEKRRAEERVVGYNVQVRLDNGDTRTIRLDSLDGLNVGDRITTQGGGLRRV